MAFIIVSLYLNVSKNSLSFTASHSTTKKSLNSFKTISLVILCLKVALNLNDSLTTAYLSCCSYFSLNRTSFISYSSSESCSASVFLKVYLKSCINCLSLRSRSRMKACLSAEASLMRLSYSALAR